jgi:hypothetical protein
MLLITIRLATLGSAIRHLPIHLKLRSSRSRKSRAIPLLPLWAFGTCYRANVTNYQHVAMAFAIIIKVALLPNLYQHYTNSYKHSPL